AGLRPRPHREPGAVEGHARRRAREPVGNAELAQRGAYGDTCPRGRRRDADGRLLRRRIDDGAAAAVTLVVLTLVTGRWGAWRGTRRPTGSRRRPRRRSRGRGRGRRGGGRTGLLGGEERCLSTLLLGRRLAGCLGLAALLLLLDELGELTLHLGERLRLLGLSRLGRVLAVLGERGELRLLGTLRLEDALLPVGVLDDRLHVVLDLGGVAEGDDVVALALRRPVRHGRAGEK